MNNNNNPEIVYAKFKEDSGSSNEGTVRGPRTRPAPPPVSPREPSGVQPRVQPSSVQNEDERSGADRGAVQEDPGDRGGDGAAWVSDLQLQGAEKAKPRWEEKEKPRWEERYEESDSESDLQSGGFVPPWLRFLAARERVVEPQASVRAMVFAWLERCEKEMAAVEVEGAVDGPAGSGHEEKPEEEEEGQNLISKLSEANLRRKEAEVEETNEEVLKAGYKLGVSKGKQLELIPNVEYFPQLDPHYLAVTICALLNSGGGQIVIGADTDGVIRGTRISRSERDLARQMLDIITRDNIEPSLASTDTDIEFLMVAGLREDERIIKVRVERVVTNIPYRVVRMDGRGFQNGLWIRTCEGANKHVQM